MRVFVVAFAGQLPALQRIALDDGLMAAKRFGGGEKGDHGANGFARRKRGLRPVIAAI